MVLDYWQVLQVKKETISATAKIVEKFLLFPNGKYKYFSKEDRKWMVKQKRVLLSHL